MLSTQKGPSYSSSAARYPLKVSKARSRYSPSTRPSPFFPRRLDPVLDGGERHKDPMVPPQMPTRHAVGKTVLDDQTHRFLLHAMGVMALGESQVVHVRVEASPAGRALVLGVGQVNVQGPTAARIAQVVQDPSGCSKATSLLPAERTTTPPVIPAPLLDPGGRQLLHPRNSFRSIRDVVTPAGPDRSSPPPPPPAKNRPPNPPPP